MQTIHGFMPSGMSNGGRMSTKMAAADEMETISRRMTHMPRMIATMSEAGLPTTLRR